MGEWEFEPVLPGLVPHQNPYTVLTFNLVLLQAMKIRYEVFINCEVLTECCLITRMAPFLQIVINCEGNGVKEDFDKKASKTSYVGVEQLLPCAASCTFESVPGKLSSVKCVQPICALLRCIAVILKHQHKISLLTLLRLAIIFNYSIRESDIFQFMLNVSVFEITILQRNLFLLICFF